MDDRVLASYREQISAADDAVLAAVNDRLKLVAELHAHKRRSDLPLFDAAREQDVVARAIARNGGPLSDAGVRQLYALLLPLCTAEAARLGEEAAPA
ncbi:MAG TPA: chorismate mutase [Gaiellales bacterium]|jgi:chorismate mutase